MTELLDKVIIFAICTAVLANDLVLSINAVAVIIAVTASAAMSYIDNRRIHSYIFVAYLLGCMYMPELLSYLPLIAYDLFFQKNMLLTAVAIVPIISHKDIVTVPFALYIIILAIISLLINYKTIQNNTLINKYNKYVDSNTENSLLLEKKNNELIEKQDYEVRLATLNERNRIARDIHDNVGHLLSRCLLQIGAMMAINKDNAQKEALGQIKNTLSQAMDSIRSSVHNIHEDSIDLRQQIESIVQEFTFCNISLEYDMGTNVSGNIKYSFIAIVKEALFNVVKHSNAKNVTVFVREHPAFYQLVIEDDGKVKNFDPDNGIGLKNIEDRVNKLRGNITVSANEGFRLFITIPKQE